MDTLQRINKAEREISALKYKIKDLKSRNWGQSDKPDSQKKNFEHEIQQAEKELTKKREEMAKLIVEHYSLAI